MMFGNCLLIGGTGYLGAHIAYEFLTKNKGDLYFLVRARNNIGTRNRLLQTLEFYFGKEFVSKVDSRINVVARKYYF
ncbi:MAG: hypothetical protein HFJ52_08970 [Clostridia bacterium]|nr:hypothetical protein [Clostridia bacterium]